MDDETKVHTCWKALAPLVRQATPILKDWRKYCRQRKSLTDLGERANTLTRSNDPEVAGEALAAVCTIKSLCPDTITIHQHAVALLIEMEDVLPLSSIKDVEREIVPVRATLYQGDGLLVHGLLFRTCQGIMMMASYLSEHCGPAPAGWPGAPDSDHNALLDDSVIDALKVRVEEIEAKQQEIHAAELEQAIAKGQQNSAPHAVRRGRVKSPINEFAAGLADRDLPTNEAESEIKSPIKQDFPKMSRADEKKKRGAAMRAYRRARKKNSGTI